MDCFTCKYYEGEDDQYPCSDCRGTAAPCSEEYAKRRSLYEPKIGPAEDVVNHPSHYETGKFECIEVMQEALGVEAVKDFCRCNAFKYIYRANRKNGVEDIRKAEWYLNKLLELEGVE